MERPFLMDEIKFAIFSLGGNKAPGPDGFPLYFFKLFWDTVKNDIFKLCEDFYFGRANLERINWANLALIPKVESPELLGDYRPISLINSTLKIISKLLAIRLSKGRCILDNVVVVEELIFSMQKRRLPGFVLKVDFAKAFDLVDWDFLLNLLRAKGFGDRWVNLIEKILVSSKANVLINGSPNGYIRYHRGLRQGDPLSPLLFVLVSDVLSEMFNHALVSKIFIGVPLGPLKSRCNLQYVDDLLILITGGLEDLRIVKLILFLFEGMSGLHANFAKTCLYSSNSRVLPDAAAAATLNCTSWRLPVTYLGIPISGGKPRKQDWEGIITKIRRRLSSWKVKQLSIGGRLMLVNSVLFALPTTYWMSIFRLPSWGEGVFLLEGSIDGLPALRCCFKREIYSSAETLFWKDRWLNGRAPMFVWQDIFNSCTQQNASFNELESLLDEQPFCEDVDVADIQEQRRTRRHDENNKKRWSLNGNGQFTVKSFYNFLNDGGLRCNVAKIMWKSNCPKKINIFNWLVWKNKVLSLENLELRRCNNLPTATCVMCHTNMESVDHLFLHCSLANEVWVFFCRLLSVPEPPDSMHLIWSSWRNSVRPEARLSVDFPVKALTWNIWLARNDRIFNAKILPTHCIIININRMLLSWFDALANSAKEKLEDSMSKVKRSLEFLGSRSQLVGEGYTCRGGTRSCHGLVRPVAYVLRGNCVSSGGLLFCVALVHLLWCEGFCYSFVSV
ncbi:uncharacterized protein LOC120258641 [Dioscorea cayenensis subsp. rotundata]|uniref:Uncharacterized protein LOC120258641 n=1 Tax=Dioscorea cayennensis subsp. rotundata TaxID=55577 RepID=A0AB40B5V5_DIOCR|nr:uncharacterized protein LOC120258641 [Dioscorea cayenensis subsp. rotundata]